MNATLVFAMQATLSLLSFGLIARWVIYPRLRERSSRDALTPLLLFETLRAIGLIVLVPGLVDAALPAAFAIPAAAGDMLAVALAFVALVAVRAGWRVARHSCGSLRWKDWRISSMRPRRGCGSISPRTTNWGLRGSCPPTAFLPSR